jgi:RNA-binding protein
VKFDEFKEEKKELAPQLAEKTSSHLIMQVGNVVVLYRKKPDAAGSDRSGSPDETPTPG